MCPPLTHRIQPHAYVPAAKALTNSSVDELIRPGLRLAFPLPSKDDPDEDKFCRVLDALGQRSRQTGG